MKDSSIEVKVLFPVSVKLIEIVFQDKKVSKKK